MDDKAHSQRQTVIDIDQDFPVEIEFPPERLRLAAGFAGNRHEGRAKAADRRSRFRPRGHLGHAIGAPAAPVEAEHKRPPLQQVDDDTYRPRLSGSANGARVSPTLGLPDAAPAARMVSTNRS